MDESRSGYDDAPGSDDMVNGPAGADTGGGVLTLVCVNCGNEYYFSGGEEPERLECGRCRGTVFRGYYTHESEDEAASDFEETTHRDLATDDAEGDAMPGDVLDLNRD